MSSNLTREDLFRMVWERPMTKVAAEFGISDVGLKKICKKHEIPVPGLGYWAKKAAGKKVPEGKLPPSPAKRLEKVVIQGGPKLKLPARVRDACAAARETERKPENRIEVDPAPEKLLAAVEKTMRGLRGAKLSETGIASVSGPGVYCVDASPDSFARVASFLNALATAAASRGYETRADEKALAFVVEGEIIEFRITELTKRSRHIPTEAELAAIEKWEKRQQKYTRSWTDYDWTPRPSPPGWDVSPTGRLKVILNEGAYGYDGLRRTFSDGSVQRIEQVINDILESLATWSAAIKTRRIEDERRRVEWEEEERRRAAQQRAAALERKRIEALNQKIGLMKQQQEALDLIAIVRSQMDAYSPEKKERAAEWIAWTEDYASRVDPLRNGPPKLLQFSEFKDWELR